ncbi:MAG TPA: hypothetical protein PLL20_13285 [Phycisphaerae bacterium]|nr:hypothetical protein [Phycisphaerae bacterium]HRR83796.1 hypothetical protein [Phycisphaerae bacterium]
MACFTSVGGKGRAGRWFQGAAIPLLCGVAMVMALSAAGCVVDSSHPPETLSGEQTIEEAETSDGTASKSVESRWTAPDQNFVLSVEVTSPEPLGVENAQLQVTLTCQLGTTKTFPVTLTPDGSSKLVASFSRAADAPDGSECVGIGGQKEAAKWKVTLSRPADTTQALTFKYRMDYRLASIETP